MPTDSPSTVVDRNVNRSLPLLPGATVHRLDHVAQIEFGGERGIIVLVTASKFEVRLPSIDWTRTLPELSSRPYRRFRVDVSDAELRTTIDKAIATRRAEFTPCRYCGELSPPERRLDDVCHGCAEKHDGIVF